jgi:hypothetical protein
MPDEPYRGPIRTCGAPEVHQRLLQDREYQRRRLAIEQHLTRFLLFDSAAARTGVTQIPAVVHVVYSNPAGNITDAQIQSQIDVLNRDFRATNPDRTKVPSVWSGLRVELRIGGRSRRP